VLKWRIVYRITPARAIRFCPKIAAGNACGTNMV